MRGCTIPGCTRELRAKGLCATHWGRMRRHGTLEGIPAYDNGRPTIADRFWSRVVKGDGCWLWIGAKNSMGYGQLRDKGRILFAHRFSYETSVGAIPPGLEVCHSCDVPTCVRPDHLFAGTHVDNMRDAASKGLMAGNGGLRGETIGNAKLTEEMIVAMRASREPAKVTADRFGVSLSTVYRARTGRTWSHVPAKPRTRAKGAGGSKDARR